MHTDHFRQFAAYNHWANRRLYAAALAMPDERYRRPTGVFFGSLHGTLNHLLLTRIWLKRLTGEGDPPNLHNAILYEDRNALARARMAEDARLIDVVGRYTEDDLRELVAYQNMSGVPYRQELGQILLHLFNHQTHHPRLLLDRRGREAAVAGPAAVPARRACAGVGGLVF
jgi:uncharacterized damage-inducible protein DinB